MTRTSWSAEELRTLLSTVSHDLRTPLSVITGRASVLRATVREEHRRDLDTIVHEAQRLSRTLENLLAITEARELTPREWVPVEELVGGVLARLESSLEGRPIEVAVPDDLLAHIDPVRGELLLANLLDHAATHTPADAPLALTATRSGRAVAIEVSTRGPELRAAQLQQLVTQRAARADGLALAACQTIITSYGGTLEASERDGGGIVFHIHLPDGEALPDLAEPGASDKEVD